MNDLMLLEMPLDELKLLVSQAFKFSREGRLLELSTSPLARSSLVDCSPSLSPMSSDLRGLALHSLLRWAIDKLRPSGAHSWVAFNWRAYNTLFYFYMDGKRVWELAELMAIAEQTWYQARNDALMAVTRLLRQELSQPEDSQRRKHYLISDRYRRHSTDEQLLLRIVALFEEALPIKLLHEVATQSGVGNIQPLIPPLVVSNWLASHERGTKVLLDSQMRPYLLTRLSPEERQRWHNVIGSYYLKRLDYCQATRHFRWASNHQRAAEIVIEHHQAMINNLQIEALWQLLNDFHQSELSNTQWAQLKIVAGDAAQLMEDIDTALAQYQQALGAKDVSTKALAYYRRAKTFQLKNLDESLAHYAYCISLLERADAQNPLLARVYIDRAWIFLEERQELERAYADLQRAEKLVAPDARAIWSDLHNAWLILYANQNDFMTAVEHGLQAWLAANEMQDSYRMASTSHNLGMNYARLGKFDSALLYLGKSSTLAKQAGDRLMEGMNHKTMGACLFMLEKLEEAITHYRQAHAIFIEMKNQTALAHTCYDLAEAYGKIGQRREMEHFFEEGLSLAQRQGYERLLEEFEALAEQYVGLQFLNTTLNERQLAGLHVIKQEGCITNRTYQELNEVSSRQALRDLNDLVKKGLLKKVGRGRSTRYVLGKE